MASINMPNIQGHRIIGIQLAGIIAAASKLFAIFLVATATTAVAAVGAAGGNAACSSAPLSGLGSVGNIGIKIGVMLIFQSKAALI